MIIYPDPNEEDWNKSSDDLAIWEEILEHETDV